MSKATLTLKIWDDRRKPNELGDAADLQISTMPEGQFQILGNGDSVVINSQQAREISRFLASNAKAED